MKSTEIHKYLVSQGWIETYINKPYIKYYRYQVATTTGSEYFYLERKGTYSTLCLHPRFFDWRNDFRNCGGVQVGGVGGNLKLQSADMLDFPTVKGRTGDDIPEFFPLRFTSQTALKKALALIVQKANLLGFPRGDFAEIAVAADTDEIALDGGAGTSDVLVSTHQAADLSFSPLPKDDGIPEGGVTPNTEQLSATLKLEIEQIGALFSNRPGTDVDVIVKRRVGQGTFRNLLEAEYGVKCHLSGITQKRLLIASHIIPWSKSLPEQKTDPENGLLLSVLWDALFDKGFISFDDDGRLLCAPILDEDMIKCLGISVNVSLDSTLMTEKRKMNLMWHRENVLNSFA